MLTKLFNTYAYFSIVFFLHSKKNLLILHLYYLSDK